MWKREKDTLSLMQGDTTCVICKSFSDLKSHMAMYKDLLHNKMKEHLQSSNPLSGISALRFTRLQLDWKVIWNDTTEKTSIQKMLENQQPAIICKDTHIYIYIYRQRPGFSDFTKTREHYTTRKQYKNRKRIISIWTAILLGILS